jgi:pheromone shutdown-related protein TraB
MHKYKNLIVLGTSHIAIESVKKVEQIIKNYHPDLIALELDKRRFLAILSKKRKFTIRDIKRLGLKGFLINYIGAWAEKKLGKSVGTKPGAEMKKAIQLAKENRIRIALIDQDINITIKKLVKSITFKEKFRFFKDLFFAPFSRQKIKFNLKKVPNPKLIKQLITKVKNRYPNIYYVIVEERNKIMANNLNKLILKYPEQKIFVIIGAGHEKEIIGELKSIENKKQ